MMPIRSRMATVLALALLWGAIGTAPVSAYVPPASQLLDLMRQALGQTAAATVRQRVSFLDDQKGIGASGVGETLKYGFPDRFRSDINQDSIRRVHVVSRGRALTAVDGQISSHAENREDIYKDVLLYNTTPLFSQRLASMGLDVSRSSLGRLDGRLVYVLGAKYPDETRLQLWLDKESYRPLRWLIPPSAGVGGAGTLDIKYSEWHRAGAIWYPWQVRFYLDGVPVRRIQVGSVDLSGGFPEHLFDIDRLKSSLAPRSAAPLSAAGDVQKAIENFRRLYE